MFCENCGHKNAKDAEFCEGCGKKLDNEPAEKKSPKKTRSTKKASSQPMTKKQKFTTGIVLVVVVVLIVIFNVLSSKTKPETIAKDYFSAFVSGDINKIYNYLDVSSSSELTSKEIFEKLYGDEVEETFGKITNYKVESVDTASNGLTSDVKISYVLKGSSSDETITVKLTKSKNKKYLFFDNWEVSMNSLNTVEKNLLKVPKDSTLTIEGVKINTSYIDKSESTSTSDVYKLPAMFTTTYNVTIKLPMGFSLDTKMTPSSYYETTPQTLSLDLKNLDSKTEKKIAEGIKENLTTIYKNVLAGKKYSEVKSTFEYDGALDDLEDSYDDFLEDFEKAYRKITKIEVTDVSIESFSIDEDTGALKVYFKYEYDYTYKYSGTYISGSYDSDSYKYSYMYLGYDNNEYKVVDFANLAY